MACAAGFAEERRDGSQVRIATARPVTIVTERAKGVLQADTVDLGPGGMFVALPDPLPVGERFIFRIDLGEQYRPVLSGGEVRWVGGTGAQRGMGIRFVDIAEVAGAPGGGELSARRPETVRVRMEHVGPAVEARVVERSAEGLVMELALPFLRPGAPLEVGPDVSARSGRVRSAEWLSGGEPASLRLVVELEPSSAGAAAGRVAARSLAEPEEAAPAAAPGLSEGEVVQAAGPAEVARSEPAEPAEPGPSLGPTAPELVPAGTTAAERLEPVAASPASEPAGTAAGAGEGGLAAVTEDDPEGEVVDRRAFAPLAGLRQRLAALGLVGRLAGLLALARGTAGRLAASPAARALVSRLRLRALAARVVAAARAAGPWLATRLGPGAKRALDRARSVKLLRRTRKQSRGEPSKIVKSLAARARRVTAGRGRTVATVLLVALGAGGLATASYGLRRASALEAERVALAAEAERAGWSGLAWQEPDGASRAGGRLQSTSS